MLFRKKSDSLRQVVETGLKNPQRQGAQRTVAEDFGDAWAQQFGAKGALGEGRALLMLQELMECRCQNKLTRYFAMGLCER